jgi:hypothetical protein
MALDTDQTTVYQVRPRHRHQEVQEVVPPEYQGVMVTDRGGSDETHSFSKVKQPKCQAHLQKTLSTPILSGWRRKGAEPESLDPDSIGVKMVFPMALKLWEAYYAGAVRDFAARACPERSRRGGRAAVCQQLSAKGASPEGPRQPAFIEGTTPIPRSG